MLTVNPDTWQAPVLPEVVPSGDMPGDKVKICDEHIRKAQTIFPILIDELADGGRDKYVVSVYGGSGVGKSEIASLLTYYLNDAGISAYTMSGDNYPHRIPELNDAERERTYEDGGIDALRGYLGSELEINFKEVNEILRLFHEGEESIYLRRMGRSVGELWYDPVDFSKVKVLVLEWTHGNNANLRGIDIPVFLASTPAETLAHRIARNRDGKPDSPFIAMVLELEQQLLISQAPTAHILVSKAGDIITCEEYLERVNADK